MKLLELLGLKSTVYESLHDLPVYNWIELHKNGDLTFLQKKGKSDDSKLLFASFKIYDHYFKEFGQNDEYKIYLEKCKSLGLQMAKYLQTGKRSELTFIKIAQAGLSTKEEKADWNEQWAIVLSNTSHYVTQRNMSTFDFLSLLKHYGNSRK